MFLVHATRAFQGQKKKEKKIEGKKSNDQHCQQFIMLYIYIPIYIFSLVTPTVIYAYLVVFETLFQQERPWLQSNIQRCLKQWHELPNDVATCDKWLSTTQEQALTLQAFPSRRQGQWSPQRTPKFHASPCTHVGPHTGPLLHTYETACSHEPHMGISAHMGYGTNCRQTICTCMGPHESTPTCVPHMGLPANTGATYDQLVHSHLYPHGLCTESLAHTWSYMERHARMGSIRDQLHAHELYEMMHTGSNRTTCSPT